MSTDILNQLDPVLIILKISDLLRECILEIVQQENILTKNIEQKDILAVSKELKDDDNWFKSVCIFLKYSCRLELFFKSNDSKTLICSARFMILFDFF